MGRSQNREYKKGNPHKDSRLFIIVAEGEREDDYFGYFENKSQRVKIKIVPREAGNSSPNDFINRVSRFLGREFDAAATDAEATPQQYDYLWFVLDVDKWKREQIDEIARFCDDGSNWHIAISNPCFEIWLYNHIADVPNELTTPAEIKFALSTVYHGGYNVNIFAPRIQEGRDRSEVADLHRNHYFPDIRITKVYQLADQLIRFLGNNWLV